MYEFCQLFTFVLFITNLLLEEMCLHTHTYTHAIKFDVRVFICDCNCIIHLREREHKMIHNTLHVLHIHVQYIHNIV